MAIWDIGTPWVHICGSIVSHLTDPNVCMRSDASSRRRDDAAYCDERLARNISVAMFCIHYMWVEQRGNVIHRWRGIWCVLRDHPYITWSTKGDFIIIINVYWETKLIDEINLNYDVESKKTCYLAYYIDLKWWGRLIFTARWIKVSFLICSRFWEIGKVPERRFSQKKIRHLKRSLRFMHF